MPRLVGSQNDDVLTGSVGDDVIEGGWGDDVIEGGDGNDTIIETSGSNIIRGGGGNDHIRLTAEYVGSTIYQDIVRTNLIEAGDGADIVEIARPGLQNITIDLGAGADLLTFSNSAFGRNGQITTGTGSDRIVLDWSYGDLLRSVDYSPLVITDFTAGAGGDVLDFGAALEALLAWNPHAANAFASGHLLLVQDGADVIVRIDIDGAAGAGSDGWYDRDLFRLVNVNASALTTYNLAGYAPDGSDLVRMTFTGTSDSEWLNSNAGGSDLNGLGGNDRLTGGAGNDVLDGGADNDHLNGGFGNDVIRGGDGDDILVDPRGADTLDGGAGNDVIDIVRPFGTGTLPVTILGGDGDDFVRFESPLGSALTVDLGAGNDRFELPRYIATAHLTLGAGQDRIVFGQFYLQGTNGAPNALVIADFTAGNSGDILELDRVILGSTSTRWNGVTNPFAGGFLILQQSGADTIVVWDYDGAGPQQNRYELARLVNVDAGTLTALNFAGFAPDGSASSYSVSSGTSGNDHLSGSYGSDIINGGDGNDLIEERKSGSDTLIGGAGDDTIILSRYDQFFPGPKVVTIDAGTGRDTVELSWGTGQLSVDLGADDDRVVIHGLYEVVTSITLGTGADIIELALDSSSSGTWPLTIQDFTTGAGGDRLDWAAYAEHRTNNGGPDYNPFYEGNARLVQVGSDVQLQIVAYDNHQSDPLFTTVMLFKNTVVTDFTADNLGYDPFHPTASGGIGNDVLTGTAGTDVLYGFAGDDVLDGLGGDDVIWAHDGADTLSGGTGVDLLRGGAGADQLHGGADADNLDGGSGIDTVDGGDGDDLIFDWFGVDTVVGGAGNDTIRVNLGHDSVAPTFGSLTAGDGNDIVNLSNSYVRDGYAIDLGAGDDVISMVHASGPLTLGEGRDTILWSTSYNMNSTLTITDFAEGDAGDVFDLVTFLEGPLGLSNPIFTQGADPFAMGHVVLRQVGNDVEMYVHREGYSAIEYVDGAVARFLNTDLSQLSAANFGGFNPLAVPNWTTVVYDDLTINAGEIHQAVNVTDVNGVSPAFMFGFAVNATLVNHGTITSRVDNLVAGSATGFYSGPAPSGGLFHNASDGHIIVRGEWVDELGGSNSARTYGVYDLFGSSVAFQNDGLLEVSAASGTAFGHYSSVGAFTNNGTLTVTSPYEAYGVYSFNSGSFVNTGSISVHGDEFAIGVYWGDITSSGFNNAGSITVTTDPDSPYASVGVYLGGRTGIGYHHYNSGTITAEIAIYADAWIRSGPGAYEIVDYLHNSGTINGAVMLAAGNDVVLNQGTMTGRTLLEDGDDLYDGTGGLHLGTVEGGAGADTLIGGSFAETLYGDDGHDTLFGDGGNDILSGDSGDDFLEGGAGEDLIDGGAGFDLASYSEATSGVTVSLALAGAQNTGGAGTDTLSGIEDLAGSEFADRLIGSAVDNYLFGLGGDDILVGGLGPDVLTGGAGNDSFQDTAGNINGDTITDFAAGDRIIISNASLAGFTFSLSGSTLTYTGGSLTLTGISGTLVASAAAGGGVQLTLAPIDPRNDFNGDGRSDILWRSDGGQFSDWLGQANGGFANNDVNAFSTVPVSWQVAGTGDFNGDGRDDVLWRNSNGELSDWLGTATGGFTPNDANAFTSVPTNWHVAGTGDFNGDGRDDILWRNDAGQLSNWLGTASGGFTNNDANAFSSVPTNWHVAGTGDFNGDGRDDILWRNDAGQLSNWLGTASGGFTPNDANAFTSVPTNWHVAGTGDFNGDGRDDILWRNDAGQLSNWLGQANGGFTNNDANAFSSVPTSWQVAAIGDYNGDGRDDILWRNSNGQLSDWLGTTTGGFTPNDANAFTSAPTDWHVQPEVSIL